ncbi:unnamed protein product, partial [Staurois parvus]
MKIRAAAPPAQRNADPRAGAITSNGTPPALENATVLGTEVPTRGCVFERSAWGFFPVCLGHKSPFKLMGSRARTKRGLHGCI